MIRPRMFSVASVVWLYLGPAWILVGGFGLYLYRWLLELQEKMSEVAGLGSGEPSEVPLVFLWFPGGALVLGIAGVWGALWLLQSREAGRRMLQRASYGAALLFIAFTLSWMHTVTADSRGRFNPSWEQMQMALLGLVCGLALAIPFFVIARKLGSHELRVQTK